ncbi:DUF3109 family protein [Weeksella virosa]|uniref:DUF3109 domain-containing protein n=1 Tax=Weeksella virosa (strain ATCC 43766 / DSM 16922 / JCM 21250 / CCUG 30538 / CDC 9751 / IAM 14551 / NBRC 16016 / NCTC 11634 / CL345/78) TaxID=865938 RepID=F0NXJ6_WEEVC|nr:DUF3109 family protein [Weeksella virosa]ADX67986.1 hypothetical protein Weevi_1282 [Weeksella virosa DSM 16922]MDK7676165.1 DUF3109 family protein [Weeksella virosa]VEH64380.1 Protein of uncharacterised function (DUF3109) [Weeksella virosa]
MFQIGKTLVSEELLKKEFVCNLSKCKGICCVEGDAGAPLDFEELDILDDIYEDIKPFLRKEGIDAIEREGKYTIDEDGEWTTPLVNHQECAYLVFEENGYSKCGIEKAYEAGFIDYKKPISCHLYPVRVKEYSNFSAVNYDVWDICSDACTLGKELQVNVAQFTKDALIRKFGQSWYDELMEINAAYNNPKK